MHIVYQQFSLLIAQLKNQEIVFKQPKCKNIGILQIGANWVRDSVLVLIDIVYKKPSLNYRMTPSLSPSRHIIVTG